MSRKLATIQTIEKIEPIEGADSIERAKVLGWHVVVKKGEFKPGMPCVYIEIDSIVPDKPEFEFLRPRGFRVKTIRLRGQISQGICFPPSIVKEGDIELGTDVTAVLGISKWEPVIPPHLTGKVIGQFPAFMPKTDETRVQVLGSVLKRHTGKPCYITEKIDGTSATFAIKDGQFVVCNRNLQLADSEENTHWKVAKELKIEEKLRSLGKNICIQGEIYGWGVQKNPFGLRQQRLAIFNAFEIDNFRYLGFVEFTDLMKSLELPTVPVLDEAFILNDDVDSLVKTATKKSVLAPTVWAEGIVIRPHIEVVDLEMSKEWGNGRLSFKVINPEYLLKQGE